MSIIRYPAVFHKEEGGYWAEFPDLPGCYTQGDTIESTYQSATEALGLYLDKEGESGDRRISKPSRIDYILQNNKNNLVMLLTFDSLEYARRYKTKAVKKTLSIPEWLNDLAVKEDVNFSQILQEALIDRLVK